ncbi:MAG: alpha/beta hydrolase [Spirochaetales bacterium]|nr:alpha/beta hydrolase [Spirochaetales bacterium]
MIWLVVILSAVAVFFLVCYIISSEFVKTLSLPKIHSYDDSMKYLEGMKSFDMEAFRNVPSKDFTISSSRGYDLKGKILFQPEWESVPRKKVIVLCHGWTSNSMTVVSYYDMYYSKGFNCIVYDHRYHGKSGGGFCSMGYYEHMDLIEVCSHARSVFGDDCILGIMGESMGAATVMLATPLIPRLAFAVEDCGYSTLVEEMMYVGTTRYHLPKWPIEKFVISLLHHRYGYDANSVSPISSVAKSEDIPMLFLHGDNDHFVPSSMMKQCYDSKKGFRMSRYFKGSAHADSYFDHPDEYRDCVFEFLGEIGMDK